MEDGAVANGARAAKEGAYPEFAATRRCRLAVVALETGGRWGDEAISFFEPLAWARAQAAPATLRRAAELAWLRRWTRLLAVSCAASFARSLSAPPGGCGAEPSDGSAPALGDLLAGSAVLG